MKRIAIIAALAVAVLAAVWFFSRPEPVAVTLVTAERGPVAATVANTRAGTVDACRRAGLSPALGGQIASLPVKDGERVEAGTLLLELWNTDLKAELTLSERDARASRSRAREACIVADVAKRDAERSARLRAAFRLIGRFLRRESPMRASTSRKPISSARSSARRSPASSPRSTASSASSSRRRRSASRLRRPSI
jgi:HlyD family secretion protein